MIITRLRLQTREDRTLIYQHLFSQDGRRSAVRYRGVLVVRTAYHTIMVDCTVEGQVGAHHRHPPFLPGHHSQDGDEHGDPYRGVYD